MSLYLTLTVFVATMPGQLRDLITTSALVGPTAETSDISISLTEASKGGGKGRERTLRNTGQPHKRADTRNNTSEQAAHATAPSTSTPPDDESTQSDNSITPPLEIAAFDYKPLKHAEFSIWKQELYSNCLQMRKRVTASY